MKPKEIKYTLNIKSTELVSQRTIPVVYTNDLNSVEFQFELLDCTDEELENSSGEIILKMRDGSFFQKPSSETAREGKVFKYVLKENEGNHVGIHDIQLEVKLAGAVETVHSSQPYRFQIYSALDSDVATEIVLTNWRTILKDVELYAEQMRILIDAGETPSEDIAGILEQIAQLELIMTNLRQAMDTLEEGVSEFIRLDGAAQVTMNETLLQLREDITTLGTKKLNVSEILWIEPATLLNNWVPYAQGTYPFGYYKDATGKVHLRGTIKSGTSQVIHDLPIGYKPSKTMRIPIVGSKSGLLAYLYNGQVQINAADATWVSFDGLSFFP